MTYLEKDLEKNHKVPPSECPNCGAIHTGAFSYTDFISPSEGDISICIKCQTVNVFAKDLSIRVPTEEEILTFSFSEIIQAQKALTQAKKEI